jgi:hypothetical protein
MVCKSVTNNENLNNEGALYGNITIDLMKEKFYSKTECYPDYLKFENFGIVLQMQKSANSVCQ